MKSLHRKISIVVLAGMVVLGGGLAAGSLSVANADSIDFQVEVNLNSLNAYGEKAGFKAIKASNGKVKDLESDGGLFNNASEVCDYIYNHKENLKEGEKYKANVDGVDFIIIVDKDGIQEVAPEDVLDY